MRNYDLFGSVLGEEGGLEFAEGVGCDLSSSVIGGCGFAAEEVVEAFWDDAAGGAG